MRRILGCGLLLAVAACATPPAPPPPVVQTPCPEQMFPVYFARDQVGLDELSEAVLDMAADHLAGCAGARLEVTGFSDPAGDADINRRISSDRAEAVVEGLMERGVAAGDVQVMALGEEGARSEAGVTEPMRRRVEVHFVPAMQ